MKKSPKSASISEIAKPFSNWHVYCGEDIWKNMGFLKAPTNLGDTFGEENAEDKLYETNYHEYGWDISGVLILPKLSDSFWNNVLERRECSC